MNRKITHVNFTIYVRFAGGDAMHAKLDPKNPELRAIEEHPTGILLVAAEAAILVPWHAVQQVYYELPAEEVPAPEVIVTSTELDVSPASAPEPDVKRNRKA